MKNKPELWILILALLATAAKVYCAYTTIGSVDVPYFYRFAKFIAEHDVITIYRTDPTFNHPPLPGNYLGLAYDMAGGQGRLFSLFHRLPGIIADLLVVGILLYVRRKTGRPSWWALGLLAVSPVSFMISGYHGNYDPLLALGITLAATACVIRQPALCGVFLGLSCQVKIIPLLLAPAFFFYWWHRGQRKALVFAAVVCVTVLVGWSGPLIGAPQQFFKDVIAYNSTWGWWGISYFLNVGGVPHLTGLVSAFAANPVQGAVVTVMKLIVIGGALTVAWRRRNCEDDAIFTTVSLVWAVFLFFAPGFGMQYLAWVSPFFLLHSERWFKIFTVAASIGLFVFYNTISGGIPWDKGFFLETRMVTWGPWLQLPWAVFGAYLFFQRRDLWNLKPVEEKAATPENEGASAVSVG